MAPASPIQNLTHVYHHLRGREQARSILMPANRHEHVLHGLLHHVHNALHRDVMPHHFLDIQMNAKTNGRFRQCLVEQDTDEPNDSTWQWTQHLGGAVHKRGNAGGNDPPSHMLNHALCTSDVRMLAIQPNHHLRTLCTLVRV